MATFGFIAASVTVSATASSPALKIYTQVPDTVYTDNLTLVAVTEPGARATVNGAGVTVYPTGSFGTSLNLAPGVNEITVSVSHDGQTNSETVRTVRMDASLRPKAKAVPDEPTTMFANPFVVETTPGAYLQYGNGDDRLGGSKMGFVDTQIPLKVIGQRGSLYCVRLAADRIAYIPKSATKPSTAGVDVINTGSWSLNNIGKADRVSISLPRRLPYQYITRLNPSTLYVDLFGATDNSNWITQRTLDLGIIENVDFAQVSEDVYRVIITLKGQYQWGFHVGYEGNTLCIDVRHAPRSLALKDLTIGLDAGHGGQYPGAISPSGLKEKDVNLDIVRMVRDMLVEQGARVVMTRDDDSGPSMAERKDTWLNGNVDLAISVHNNSGGSPLSSPGTAVLFKHPFNRPLALTMTESLLKTGLPLFGVVGNFNFSLNGPTEYPNILIEGMFMSSLEEEAKLADKDFRRQFASRIVAGLKDYLNQVAKSRK